MISSLTQFSLFYFQVANLYESIALWIVGIPLVLFFCLWAFSYAKEKIFITALKKVYRYCAPKSVKSFLRGIGILIVSLMIYRIITWLYSFASKGLIYAIITIAVVALLVWSIWKLVKWYNSLHKGQKFVLFAGINFYFYTLFQMTKRFIRFLT